MPKKLPILLLSALSIISFAFFLTNYQKTNTHSKFFVEADNGIGSKENPQARLQWELQRIADPQTGKIPAGMRLQELDFAKKIRNKYKNKTANDTLNWISRGPYNVGGRTRAVGIDVANEKIILAGSPSGGMWRSIDSGQSWQKTSTADHHPGVTCLAQDTRPNKTNTWYYATGEGYGASPTDGGAYYLGNGMYKSTDNGLTWQPLAITNSNTPETFDNRWDITWNIATDPYTDTADIVYGATYGRIMRSIDGGETWEKKLGSTLSESYFSDVAVTKTGVAYATLSSDGGTKGIFRSADAGNTFQNILPTAFPTKYDRIVIGTSQSTPNQVYFLAVTPDAGKETFNYIAEPEHNSLWRYTYLSGDGSGTGGTWEDLSQNLPIGPYRFDDFNVQGGYDLLVKVKPDDANTVFIGGTNLYRSTDGFTTPNNTTYMGGYDQDTDLPLFYSYENHHPDQHNLAFLPSNPNVLISANDGGLWQTDNCMANNITWKRLNNGYVTSQFYTIAFPPHNNSPILIGGLQDNGTQFTESANPTEDWTMTFNYDGAFCAIPANENYYIMSTQECKMVKLTIDEQTGKYTNFTRIDPQNASDYLFINPFVLSPTDNKVLYLAEGAKLWVNTNLTDIPIIGGFDSITTNWIKHTDTIPLADTKITALTATTGGKVYLGTSKKKVYRVDNAISGTSTWVDITGAFPSSGYVTCITANPFNDNEVYVLFSNYKVYSMFQSKDAGATWQKVAGNLEANNNGTGAGPSFRWLSILPLNNDNPDSLAYFLGTSVGLFYTTKIDGTNTEWIPTATETIGNAVVEMVECRPHDKMIAVATHANGVFSANTPPLVGINPTTQNNTTLNAQIAPNPIPRNTGATLTFNLPKTTTVQIQLFDITGKNIKTILNPTTLPAATQLYPLTELQNLKPGIYFCQIKTGTQQKQNLKIVIY